MRFPPYSGTHDVRWSWLEWVPPPRRWMKGAALVAVMSGRKQDIEYRARGKVKTKES
ncbi:predicted protein [Arabidopsis lyrata subsp. lyrata]|uniref:Predicted protein n=1 Tax=Arabidopsis lyrata subsp. lyrata TaxID=81972 RepID=D7M589_ARALL|nr:predicted protein [Arabidopsis lyrata subsp. lyrata]